MLLWLPAYADKELNYNNPSIELIAIVNDVGTIMGSITLGKISDLMYKKRSPIAFFGLIIGGILFLLIAFLSDSSKYLIYTLIFFVGFIVGGVFNIVTATAAADLAKGDQIQGNSKALSTVTGILDGCGSLGAAFGSLIIGEIRKRSWNGVFIFLA
jgi:MFS transporter, OPA family, solute carrier family 37 (glycerol-3-phosphate transporter), member 3